MCCGVAETLVEIHTCCEQSFVGIRAKFAHQPEKLAKKGVLFKHAIRLLAAFLAADDTTGRVFRAGTNTDDFERLAVHDAKMTGLVHDNHRQFG